MMNKLLLHRFYLLGLHLKDVDLQFLPEKIIKHLKNFLVKKETKTVCLDF